MIRRAYQNYFFEVFVNRSEINIYEPLLDLLSGATFSTALLPDFEKSMKNEKKKPGFD